MRARYQRLKKLDSNQIVQENIQKIRDELQKSESLIDHQREDTLFFWVVKNKPEVYDIITRSFGRKKRYQELPHGLDLRNSWNFMWSWSKIRIDISKLLVWQKCNHFPQSKQICRKDCLKKNLERACKVSAKNSRVFNILPETYVLPKEYVHFVNSFTENEGPTNLWILKPVCMSRGWGIHLVNDLSDVQYGEAVIMQRYITNPLLLNGFKFDLRIYVLVTSFNPLEAFIYKEGFARLATSPFSINALDIRNKFIHLTNYSIQKKAGE